MHTSKSIARALLRALRRGEDPKVLAKRVVEMLGNSSHAAELPNILSYLERFKDEEQRKTHCQIESAFKLSSKEIDAIKTIFGAREASLKVNPSLLGGFRAEYNDLLFDATLKKEFDTIRETLINV